MTARKQRNTSRRLAALPPKMQAFRHEAKERRDMMEHGQFQLPPMTSYRMHATTNVYAVALFPPARSSLNACSPPGRTSTPQVLLHQIQGRQAEQTHD